MDGEFYILNYIQDQLRTDFLDKLMPAISFLGKAGLIWIVIALLCLFFKRSRLLGRSLVFNLIFNLVASSLIIKPIVSRLRPCVLDSTVELLVKLPFDTSFPSGHTLFAFGAATIIFIYNKWLGTAAYIFGFLMAFSRLYLYVHFPTDVAFGAVFGVIFAVIAYKMEGMIFDRTKPLFVIRNRHKT